MTEKTEIEKKLEAFKEFAKKMNEKILLIDEKQNELEKELEKAINSDERKKIMSEYRKFRESEDGNYRKISDDAIDAM